MIDTHAHLEYPDFAGQQKELIEAAQKVGVEKFIAVGGERPRNQYITELIDQYDCVYGALGIHPNWANSNDSEHLDWIESNLTKPKIVAIGEIGLDYHHNYAPFEVQQKVFRLYIELAQKQQLPIIIHTREAFVDTLEILSQYKNLTGVVHCFSYDEAQAEAFLELGLHISFCGQITFKKCDQLRKAASQIPLERLLLETDCPFLAPEPKRGRQNKPEYLKYIAEKHADIRQLPIAEIDRATTANAKKLFNIE